jgi:hypothetical protein
MSGFLLKLNRLRNIPYASSIQESLPFEKSFDVEYFFEGQWNLVVIKPILITTLVVFLVHFPEGDRDSIALVYNKKEAWSDIERESTRQTDAIGTAIENYYSSRYLPWMDNNGKDKYPEAMWDNHLLN